MSRFWRNWWWLVAILIADVFFAIWWFGPRRQHQREAGAARSMAARQAGAAQDQDKPSPSFLYVGFPTAQTGLQRLEDPSVYMATASGRIESAHYGSTRTRNAGGKILPSFHEGIDIAPLERDRRNRALDTVHAIADGTVGYANRVIGNSNYGLYVVLVHEDAVGAVYSLYAHLRSVAEPIKPGTQIKRGDIVGVMGNTPSSIIPVARSHLHFEVGMIQNRRFDHWASTEDIRNVHGLHHGWNLTGIQPLALFPSGRTVQPFSMLRYLETVPVAFDVVVDASRPIDYFLRYPALWKGGGDPLGAIVLSVSEGGVVLRGRRATSQEVAGRSLPYVLQVDQEVLGRNGLRLVVSRQGAWQVGRGGLRWLDILLH